MTRVTQGIERDGYPWGFLVDLFPIERLIDGVPACKADHSRCAGHSIIHSFFRRDSFSSLGDIR